jgi:hypothetical protein
MKRKGRPVRSGRLWPWLGNGNHCANAAKDFLAHTAGGKQVIFRDVFPNLDNILCRKRMKAKALLCGH